ncbi:MAG: ABC-2 type transport system permease protein [Planctomycetota bacterium]|jgi:ABC-2 type transport system permease protein
MANDENKLSPPSGFAATSLLAIMQLNALLKGKRVIFLFVLLGVPLFISVVLKLQSSAPERDFSIVAPQAFLVFLLPLIGLFHGSSALSEEVDQRTLGYLLLRPIPREQIAFGKFIGAWATTVFIIGVSIVSCHVVVGWEGSLLRLWQAEFWQPMFAFLAIMSLGAAVYVAFSLFLSLRLKRPVFVGLFYIVIVEFLFPVIPGPISNLAMTTHLQRLMPERYQSMEAVVAEEARIIMAENDPWISGAVLMLVFGSLATATLMRFRNYDLSYGEE